MDTNSAASIISTSGAALVGVFGLWINSKRMDDMRVDIRDLRPELATFREMVTGKLSLHPSAREDTYRHASAPTQPAALQRD